MANLQTTIKNEHLLPLNSSINKDGHLVISSCDTTELAKEFGTPLYIIDKETLVYNATEYLVNLKTNYCDFLVLYGAKAFACSSIFKIINDLEMGIDVVSGGEIYTALQSGFNKSKIYFHGNNKLKSELELAVKNDIGRIVCDNFYELELLNEITRDHKKPVNILIRLTPGIECHTHAYIRTGHLDSKFGFDIEQFDNALEIISKHSKNLILKGLHAHIGSQIFEVKPYLDTIEILLEQFLLAKEKYKIELSELNIGGGLGIPYTDKDKLISVSEWAKSISTTIKECCKKFNLKLPKLLCEPGRSIIGRSGITLYTVGSIKQVPNGKKYISVDGGMTDNPRAIIYQAEYTALVANKMSDQSPAGYEMVTIAGKYCESGDLLIQDILLPKVVPGDIIALLNTGAYNYSMSSNYNMTPKPACILINNSQPEIIIERESYKDLISKQRF